MTKKRLAELVDVSVRSITAYESGELEPAPLTLSRLAGALKFPPSFFGAPDLEELPADSASFRALTRMTAAQRDAALGSGTLAVALHDWIAERFKLPAVDVPKIGPGVDPETAAEAARGEWGLGQQPIPNMVHLLEARGVRVFSLAMDCMEVDAFSSWSRGTPFVFLNNQKSSEHRRFDAAHELGHLVLHWHHEVPHGRDAEQEAHWFASAFLMPRASLLASAPRLPTIANLMPIKKRWKVSLAALIYRLHQLERLTDWQYRSLYLELGKRGYRKREPRSIPGENSQVLRKVFTMLRKDGVGRAQIAQGLNMFPADLDALVRGLAVVPVEGEGATTERPTTHGLTLIRGGVA